MTKKLLWLRLPIVFLLLHFGSSGTHQPIDEQSPAYLFSLHHLYPHNHFYRVEKTLKQFLNDLETVLQDFFLLNECLEKSDYFYQQGQQLERSTRYLKEHGYEMYHYLTDDLAYLLVMTKAIEEKIVQLMQIKEVGEDSVMHYLYKIVMASKSDISYLLAHNREKI